MLRSKQPKQQGCLPLVQSVSNESISNLASSICLPVLTYIISFSIHLLMTYNYTSAPLDKIPKLPHSFQLYICDIEVLATANMRKLKDKTELMPVAKNPFYILSTSITIGNAQIPLRHSVKNFGYALDC